MKFSEKLRELKEASGLSEAKLSERSGVKLGALHTYILGSREPSFAAVVRIARALGVSVEVFTGCVSSDEGEPSRASKTPGRPPKPKLAEPAAKRARGRPRKGE